MLLEVFFILKGGKDLIFSETMSMQGENKMVSSRKTLTDNN
jgi:hypothetical protein